MKYVSDREDPGKYINQAIEKLYKVIEEICPAEKEDWVKSELEEVKELVDKYNKAVKSEEERLEIIGTGDH